MKKKRTNENVFDAAKRLSDAFFDGLKKNTADRILAKAKSAGMPDEVVKTMDRIRKDKEELDQLLQKIADM